MKLKNILLLKYLFLFLVIGMVFTACSTKKNTWTRRAFHNVTAHYNGWWNGNESLKDGVRESEKNTDDNYNEILPVYNYGDETQGQAMASYSDRAIEKGSMVAQRHTMWFKKREYCKWVPESYFLIGKAYFYKHEYQSARQTFEFITKKYHYDDIRHESMLWLAKTYIELENFQKAETFLDQLSSRIGKEEMPNHIPGLVNAVFADLYIKQENPSSSVSYLKEALLQIHEKDMNNRMIFILAQVYQENNKNDQATELYKYVVKKNRNYQTTFNAKMNLARLYQTSSGDSKALVKSLKKMLKDVKNIDYHDQIYYALSEVAITDGEDGLAIKYLRLSVASSVKNDYQKAVSSLEVAEMLYENKDYQMSGAYYDTAMIFLPEDYPNYREVKRQTAIVSDLVGQLTIVQVEDSLQILAAMPRPQLDAMIDSLIQIIIEEEERLREEELMRQQAIAMGAQSRRTMGPGMGSPVGGGWYFYNPQAMSMGYSEFIAKWGSRKLEDNWRLSDKQQTVFSIEDEIEGEVTADSLMVVDSNGVVLSSNPKDRNYYLQNIPLQPSQIEASNEKISQALYQAGFIYKESMKEYPEAIITFEDFNTRNEEPHDLSNQIYFQLYLLYDGIGNKEKADYYKNLLINNYPDSDYAKLLLDPNYFKELEKKHNRLKNLYEKTYKAYEKGQYTMVVYNCDQALSENKDDDIIPKFLYLKAISMAKTDVVDSMTVNLTTLLERYPDSEVAPLAENILQNLGLYNPDDSLTPEELEAKQQMEEAMSMYVINQEEEHYFVVMVNSKNVNVNGIKTRMSDFNKKAYSANNLSVSSLLFDDPWQMITINKFSNAHKAMMFYRAISNNVYVFPEIEKDNFKQMVISLENYPKLYQDKDVEKYLKLFSVEYQ